MKKIKLSTIMIGVWIVLLVSFGVYSYSVDYASNHPINTLTDVSGALTKAALVPVQDIADTDKIGSASIEDLGEHLGGIVITEDVPFVNLEDSTAGKTADAIIKNTAADANDAVLALGVDDSGGDDQVYIECDGVTETVDLLKSVVVGSGGDPADTGTINLKNGDVIAWEDAAEATITHVNDTGWDFKAGLTTDDQPIKVVLKTSETDMAADDVLGGIYFQAPDEAATGDAQLVAAGIEAVSEGDFSAISNATELSFKTGASEIATSKMTLSSAGVLTLSAGGIVIPDTGNIGSATDTNAIAIDGSGGVACTATTAATGITAAALETAGGLGVTYDIWVGDDIVLDSDSAVIQLGADQDVKITHVADVGFNVKETGTGAGTPVKIVMQNGELDIAGGDVIGGIYFQAPDEGTETDSQLVCAGIEAVSEGNFAADNNATKLSFQTGASETAAEKMALSSAGVLTTTSDVELGHATDTTIARSAAGAVTIEGKQIVLTGVAAGREFSVHNESHGEAQEDITEAQILASKFFTNQGSAGETDSRLPAVSYYISITLIVNEAQIWEIEPPDTEAFDLNGTVLAADDVIDSPTGIGAKIVLTRMLLADGTTWRWSADTVRGVWVDGDAED